MITSSVYHIAEILKAGGIAAIPTETVYGLAADATRCEAVEKIYTAKNRPVFNPLITHYESKEQLQKIWDNLPLPFQEIADKFWPGPLTLIVPAPDNLCPYVTAGLPTAGIRIPNHPLTLELIRICGFPLAAPSANPSGSLSPVSANQVADSLHIPILDGGSSKIGLESTILDTTTPIPKILRPGAITFEMLKKFIPEIQAYQSFTQALPNAPGQLRKHYAPDIPMFWLNSLTLKLYGNDMHTAQLWFDASGHPKESKTYFLSEHGNLAEAARNLFSLLRKIKNDGFSRILVEKLPETGLGPALNDRINRGTENPF